MTMLANSALACSFVIAFNTQFETSASRLPASEVRRLAEWLIDEPGRYENQKEFHIFLYAAPGLGVSRALAHRRASHLQHWLTTLRVPESKISVEVGRYRPGVTYEPLNFAQVDFMPGCPHPCCPGMVPIVK
ncbi:hypothetical protein BKK81_02405 [Cupriavidus sp. USMAHM13]|uniref:hypothetical protein n=1 Tax=Cupriavidus sp. USMAHM13 TaxID=1389192 RepID=UPI0008A6E07D|nr:hypothetical protein [Cupriavidus sp. USMAHM13]AOY98270.1 hypothetical protein BKK81_02405 [Cupriavidus sp. USMAHM13]